MFGCYNNRCRCQSTFWPTGYPWYYLPCNNLPPIAQYELGGVVFGIDGIPVSGINISYTVNGHPGSTITNASGAYIISVPANANVTISAIPGVGVTATPAIYTITGVNGNIYGLDFTLSVV